MKEIFAANLDPLSPEIRQYRLTKSYCSGEFFHIFAQKIQFMRKIAHNSAKLTDA